MPVLQLPGDGCRFWVRGRCLYAEFVNPGLEVSVHCAVLGALDGQFDNFLDRCERLGLKEETMGEIWKRRCAAFFDGPWPCVRYLPHSDPQYGQQCQFFLESLCLLCFPLCPGRCRRFIPRASHEIEGFWIKEL